ncbi:hypothetical protein PFLUV_G00260370 [Perca fluviatilis]|uniref:Uncharacterized protein n=1 Tax=Perca fluviatilis TaxID=8168 RepID=A0A6A5DU69_PERFL|nr:hypothetical protein PFLUV_G00260370 [Perca fluviatilis]
MERLEWQKERIAMEREIEMLRGRLRTQQKPESPEPEPEPDPEPEPEPSCVSFKSDGSYQGLIDFKGEQPSAKNRIHQRPDSAEPEPSCVSFKSDWSHQGLIDFKEEQPSAEKRVDKDSSEVSSGQSAQQHQKHLDSIFMLLEENIVTFVKNELKKIQKVLSPDHPECSESQREDEDEEQRSKEAFLKITLHFLRRMKQDQLADRLQNRSPARVCRPEVLGEQILDSAPELERAHQTLAPKEGSDDKPRAVMLRFHRFQTGELVVREARLLRGKLSYKGSPFHNFEDYAARDFVSSQRRRSSGPTED